MMRYSSGSQTALNHENLWKKLILSMVRITVVYSIVSMSIIALSFRLSCHSLRESASFLGIIVGSGIYHSVYCSFLACHYGEEKSFG